MSAPCRSTLALLAVFFIGERSFSSDDPPSQAEIAKLGKASTALVDMKPRYATAFCIHPSGLFVTNDHGRHSDAYGGFQNHGDACSGCRHIMLVMAGPDTRAGFVSAAHHDQRDIARTIGYLLGVPMPLAQGNVLDDILLEPSIPLAVPGPTPLAGEPALAVYPNPMRTQTAVRLAGVGRGSDEVDVLDSLGRRVASLVAQPDRDGAPVWTWDGRSADGLPAAPGAYFVRVRERGRTHEARLVKLQ